MKRLLLSLGLWLGLLTSAFATTAVMRDANYTLKDTDTQVTTAQTFSAPRSAILPGLGTGGSGNISIIDAAGAINTSNTLIIAAQSGETINGSSNLVVVLPGSRIDIVRGPSGWTATASAGGGASNGFTILQKSGAASALTGTVSETALATIVTPANLLGLNGQIRITAIWTCTNSVNNKILRIRLGAGLSGTIMFTTTQTTNANVLSTTQLVNTNSTSAQSALTYAARGTDTLPTLSAATGAIDMTASQSITFSGQLANTGENITLVAYAVEYAN